MGMARYLAYLTFISIFCSCSAQKSTSSIQIQFQSKGVSAQTLSAEDIGTIIVNVSGPGISQSMYVKKECEDTRVLCNEISIDGIPSGSSRLIQLLVVTKEKEDGSDEGIIYYGDVTQELNGDVTVPITLSEKGNFLSEADFMGRYIPKLTHKLTARKLTGRVAVKVPIDSSKPELIVGHSEIFGGYFHFFLLDNVKFKYYFTGWDHSGNYFENIEIFNDYHSGDGLNISAVPASGNKVVHFDSDKYIRRERSGNSFMRKFKKRIFALIGPGVQNACYDSSFVSYNGSNGASEICKSNTSPCGSYLQWADIDVSPSASDFECSETDNSRWELNVARMDRQELVAGFYGPFSTRGRVDNKLIDFISAGSGRYIVKPDSSVYLSRIDVFTKTTGSFDRDTVKSHEFGDGYDCNKLKLSGFSGAKTTQKSAAGVYSYVLTTEERSALNQGKLNVAFCPVDSSGRYYNSVIITDSNVNQVSQTPTKLKIGKLINPLGTYLNQNACVPIYVELQNELSQPVHVASPVTFDITLSGSLSTATLHESMECDDTSISASGLQTDDRKLLFLKPVNDGSIGQITVADVSAVLSSDSRTIGSVQPSAVASEFQILPDFYRSGYEIAVTEYCTPFIISATDSNGELAPISGSPSYHLQASVSGGGWTDFFHDTHDCSSTVISAISADFSNLRRFWIDTNGLSSADTVQVHFTSCGLVGGCTDETFTMVTPGSYNHFRVELEDTQSSPAPSSCIPIRVSAFDNHSPNSYPTNFPNNNTIQLTKTVGNGSLFTEGTCSGGGTPAVNIPANNSSSEILFYYKTIFQETSTIEVEYEGETFVFSLITIT